MSLLHCALYLEQEESVSFRREIRFALSLVRPVYDKGAEPSEACGDLLCERKQNRRKYKKGQY